MPLGDGSKEKCFIMWKMGKTLKETQRRATAQSQQVRDWFRDWQRGKQKKWDVDIEKTK